MKETEIEKSARKKSKTLDQNWAGALKEYKINSPRLNFKKRHLNGGAINIS